MTEEIILEIKTRNNIYLECAFPRSHGVSILCPQETFLSTLNIEQWFIRRGSEGCSIMDLYDELRYYLGKDIPDNKKVRTAKAKDIKDFGDFNNEN